MLCLEIDDTGQFGNIYHWCKIILWNKMLFKWNARSIGCSFFGIKILFENSEKKEKLKVFRCVFQIQQFNIHWNYDKFLKFIHSRKN